MELSNPDWKFTNNHLVVITTNTEIYMEDWREYLLKHWDELFKDNTRLLILGGIHGGEKGELGMVDKNIEEWTMYHIVQIIEKHKKQEMIERNIRIYYECVGDFLDKGTWKPNPEELVQAIVKHQPTLLLLAFCYTSQSILNDCLKSQGIYSMLIMQRERSNITQGQHIFLDEHQKSALFKIAKNKPSLVMLQGSFGTGKTILLMEALRIKIAQYKEAQQRFKVVVTSDTRQAQLIDFLRSNYCFDNVDIHFYDCLRDVYVGDYEETFGPINTIRDLNKCVRRLQKCLEDNVKVIIVIDEFFIRGKQDWNRFSIKSNVDVLLAFHPRKNPNVPFALPHEENDKVFSCTLRTAYRNSSEVLKLYSFLSSHASQFTEKSKATAYPLLNPGEIESISHLLPSGESPIWIELHSDVVHPLAVFRYIKKKYLNISKYVSFIIDDSHTHSEDVKKWLVENGYNQHSSSEFAQVAFAFEHSMRGLEDEIIVYMPTVLKDHGLLLEAVTRARKTVICVTKPSSNFTIQLLLDSAHEHHWLESCELDGNTKNCAYVQSRKLIHKEKVSNKSMLLLEMESLSNYSNEIFTNAMIEYWLVIQSFLAGSDECCHVFVRRKGLERIVGILNYYSNYIMNNCFVRIFWHLGSVKSLIHVLRMPDILDFLKDIANSLSYKDMHTRARAGLLHRILRPHDERYTLGQIWNNLESHENLNEWCENWLKQLETHGILQKPFADWVSKLEVVETLKTRDQSNNTEAREHLAEVFRAGDSHLLISLMLHNEKCDRRDFLDYITQRHSPLASVALLREVLKWDVKEASINKWLQDELCKAVEKGKFDATKALFEAGAPVDRKVGEFGQTALHRAIQWGRPKTAEFLVVEAQADTNICDRDNNTALHYAVEKGNARLVKLLCENGAELDKKGRSGLTALPVHWASLLGCVNIVQLLLKYGADINLQSDAGRSALHYASMCGNVLTVDLLLKSGADASIVDKDGLTAQEGAGKFCQNYARRREAIVSPWEKMCLVSCIHTHTSDGEEQ